MILLILACDPEPPATPPEGPSVPTLLGTSQGVDFAGNWTSPNCGGRAYARNIRFEDDNTYAALDLVQPCAPGAQCIWSGMVGYAGTWAMDGDKKLRLLEMGAPSGPGSPHPNEFTADFNGTLLESGCTYTRGLTIPTGYNEAQVTPRVPTAPVAPPEPQPNGSPSPTGSSTPSTPPTGQ